MTDSPLGFTARSQRIGRSSPGEAYAHRIGFPVALKVMSPQITHKTDAGGVEIDLADDQACVFRGMTGQQAWFGEKAVE